MKKYLNILVAAGLFLSSCGASRQLESAQNQIAKLNEEIATLQAKLSDKTKQNEALQQANEMNSRDAAAYRAQQEEARLKTEKLEKELAARGTSLQEVDAKMRRNVEDFRQVGCEVEYKNGRFFITVPDDFTFMSGSTAVGPQSRQALNVVAQVMRDDPGVMATIIGNTDSLPMNGIADNWSLSTERANAVIRMLKDTYFINPDRLTAAGRSQYNPVASNETPEGRQKNRRIEIIINPRLERLAALLEK